MNKKSNHVDTCKELGEWATGKCICPGSDVVQKLIKEGYGRKNAIELMVKMHYGLED
tara:strand:+ start:664 stop:834 length:171 start_codon:yes stop_codon:yes gene_type:complete